MTLFFVLVCLAVLGCVLAVAAGWISAGLDDAASPLPPAALPPGEVTPGDVDAVRFAPALRGYRMDQVDAALDRLSDELERTRGELRACREQIAVAAPGPGPEEPDAP